MPRPWFRRGGASEAESGKRLFSFHRLDLEETFSKRGCAVCLLLKRYDVRRLDALLYESVNDVFVRDMIRKSLGFCNYHSSVMGEIAASVGGDLLSASGAPLGIGMIHIDLVETIIQQLKVGTILNRVRRHSRDQREICPICRGRGELELAYLQTIVRGVSDFDFREKYLKADGLCATHLIKALKLQDPYVNRQTLAAIETLQLERLAEDLREFIRKHDYRYSKEGSGKEADSWLRALRKISGEPFAAINRESPM